MAAIYTTLKLTFDHKLATLTLSRAEKRNAICHALIDEFPAALHEVEESAAQVLIVAAEGKAFSAGLDLEDLKTLATHTAEENRAHSQRIARVFQQLYQFPKTTIAIVNGAAIAGGAMLATLCDFTLASAAASFGFPEVRIGFVPAIVSAFLLRQICEKHARALLLTGRVIRADEACRIGLVNEVVEAGELPARARRLAEELLENSPASLQAAKALLRSYGREQLSLDLNNAVEANARMRQNPDFLEGVQSVLERRKPKWHE